MAAGNAARLANRRTSVPQHARVRVFPANRKRLIHLNILAGLDAAAAKDALVGIVAIKRIRRVHLVGFRFERDFLMLDGEKPRGVMDCAVTVVVVADRAVEHVIAENPVERFPLSGDRPCGSRGNVHPGRDVGGAGPDQFAVHLHHARVAGLNRAKLRVIANLGNFRAGAVDEVNETFIGLRLSGRTINC